MMPWLAAAEDNLEILHGKYAVEKMKNYEHAGLMHIQGIERSRLAAFAEENM